jgi:hypothetical protein
MSVLARCPGAESTLRPVLVSLGARRILGGLSVCDCVLAPRVDGALETNLHPALQEFADAARRGQGGVVDETAVRLGA